MPRRTIRLGLQPSSFSFEDQSGPLVNGLANAAQSFMEGGQRRAELEMAREQRDKEDARSNAALARQAHLDLQFENRQTAQDKRQAEMDAEAMRHTRFVEGQSMFDSGFKKVEQARQQRLDEEKLKKSTTGSDAFTPDESAFRQKQVDREAIASGVMTYVNVGDKLSPRMEPMVAPGRFADYEKLLKKHGLSVPTPEVAPEVPGGDPMATPPGWERTSTTGGGTLGQAAAEAITPPGSSALGAAAAKAIAPTPKPGYFGGSGITPADEWNASNGLPPPVPGAMTQPGVLDRMFGTGTESAYADAGASKNGFAAVQAMRSGDGTIDTTIGGPNYKIGLQTLAQLDEKTRESEILAILQRDPAYAKQVISDLLAVGVK